MCCFLVSIQSSQSVTWTETYAAIHLLDRSGQETNKYQIKGIIGHRIEAAVEYY